MKKTISFVAAAVIFGSALVFSGCNKKTSSAEVTAVKIGVSATSSKLHYFDNNGNETGYEFELLKLIDETLPQYKIQPTTMEYSSLFVSLQSGTISGAIGNFHRSESRDSNYLRTTYAYNFSPNYIMVFDTDTQINGIEDLSGKKAGVGQGTTQEKAVKEFNDDHPELAPITPVYTKDYVNDLYSKRVDCVIIPELSLDFYNTCFNDVKFKLVGKPVEMKEGPGADSNAYMYFSKENEKIRDDFSAAIKTLRDNGKLSELHLKFFAKDHTKEIRTNFEEEYLKELGR